MAVEWLDRLSGTAEAAWFPWDGQWPRVVLSSRCVLRRNLDGILFPPFGGHEEEALKSQEKLLAAIDNHPEFGYEKRVEPRELNTVQRCVLASQKLADMNFLSSAAGRTLMLTRGQDECCHLNSRNHLTLCAYGAGLQLGELTGVLQEKIAVLGTACAFAHDSYFGYLCTAPELCGTGFSAHVHMNLPGIIFEGYHRQAETAAAELGFTLEFDRSKESFLSHLALVSAYNLPHCTPLETAARLDDFVRRLEGHELHARQKLLDRSRLRIQDVVGRARALLGGAFLLNVQESIAALSSLWFGQETGLVTLDIPLPALLRVLTTLLCQSKINKEYLHDKVPMAQDAQRATWLRRILSGSGEQLPLFV